MTGSTNDERLDDTRERLVALEVEVRGMRKAIDDMVQEMRRLEGRVWKMAAAVASSAGVIGLAVSVVVKAVLG